MTGALFPTAPTPRTDAAIIRDKMILSEVGLLEIVDAGTCRQLERDLAAAQEARDQVLAIARELARLATCMDAIPRGSIGEQVEKLDALEARIGGA